MEESEQKTEARLISLEMDYGQIEGWKPEVEKRLKNLMLELKRANKIMERGILENDGPQHGLLRPEGSTAARTSVGIHTVDGPNGYRGDHDHRDRGFGHVTFQTHGPVKGFNRGGVFSKVQLFLHFHMHHDMVTMASIFQGRGMRILIVREAKGMLEMWRGVTLIRCQHLRL
ncbi:uncharacterized protein [Zea mays]|uniref:uncharacterized protein n=1 Tax=Zea mays TaxID=4577 RepID=UPI0004DE82EF|nr:uncharacterized protein LOC103650335 [Zea mays]|eukprot:XP_020405843.1 uncharacterized protein LOC103650335 [Zea mays]